ncbi:MAG: response regulator [Pricia sp.]|nr:response regulator [Pricia sp.]
MKPIIYIIDDNIVSEFATKLVLEQINIDCKVISFEEAEQGLNALLYALTSEEDVPNIVLLDLKMPGIDGWEFLDKLSELYAYADVPPIYMVSNFTSSAVRKKANEHGFLKGYIERPISKNRIEEILATQD